MPRNGSQSLTLVHSIASAIVMLMVSLSVRGPGYIGFLEGCFRALEPSSGALKLLLSSGTEDYFLGTYYFNKGAYITPLAGVTKLNRTGGHGGEDDSTPSNHCTPSNARLWDAERAGAMGIHLLACPPRFGSGLRGLSRTHRRAPRL